MNTSDSWKKIMIFCGLDAEDISDRFFNFIILGFILFLFTQTIYTLFLPFNALNTLITFAAFLFFCITFLLLKIEKIRVGIKYFYLFFSHIILVAFWFASEGLLGSIPGILPCSIFIIVVTLPRKYSMYGLIGGLILYAILVTVNLMYPEWAIPYDSQQNKMVDVVMGIFFTSILMGSSFLYLRNEYENKVEELETQYKAQSQLNEELDNFVYRTSHDLRAPLASSLGLIDIIESAKSEDELKRYLALQRKSLLKMDNFIQDILNYSRNSRMEVTKQAVDFQEIFKESLAQNKFSGADTMDIQLHLSDLPPIESDVLRLQVIFNNVISNAIRYADKTKPYSFVKVLISQKEEKLNIRFEDNGVGISAENLPKIFNMFFRANYTSTGSGVGLYIVKQSIEKLGGTIVCTSELGIGTTFEIVLPM